MEKDRNMQVQYERLETDTLTREMVEDETDLDTLYDWHLDQKDVESDIMAQISAYRSADIVPPLKMVQKLGFVRTGLMWIERQIVSLGGTIQATDIGTEDATKMAQLKQQVLSQARQLTEQAAALKLRNEKIAELRAQLKGEPQ